MEIEPTTSGFDRPLLYGLSYEANGSNLNVKGTNECCPASTKDTNVVSSSVLDENGWEIKEKKQ